VSCRCREEKKERYRRRTVVAEGKGEGGKNGSVDDVYGGEIVQETVTRLTKSSHQLVGLKGVDRPKRSKADWKERSKKEKKL